jgi:hypothetical protein
VSAKLHVRMYGQCRIVLLRLQKFPLA